MTSLEKDIHLGIFRMPLYDSEMNAVKQLWFKPTEIRILSTPNIRHWKSLISGRLVSFTAVVCEDYPQQKKDFTSVTNSKVFTKSLLGKNHDVFSFYIPEDYDIAENKLFAHIQHFVLNSLLLTDNFPTHHELLSGFNTAVKADGRAICKKERTIREIIHEVRYTLNSDYHFSREDVLSFKELLNDNYITVKRTSKFSYSNDLLRIV